MSSFRHALQTLAGIVRTTRPLCFGLMLAVVAVAGCLATGGAIAQAAGPTTNTTLRVEPVAPVDLGTATTVSARLTTPAGGAIVGQTVGLIVDGIPWVHAVTDASGNVLFNVPGDLEAGTHPLSVVFDGTETLASATARLDLVIIPATVEVQTVPALAGIEFSLDGHPFASDADGVARYTVTRIGDYTLEVVSTATDDTNTRIAFSRWGDQVFRPSRQVSVPSKTSYRVGFNVSYLTNLTFVDAENQPVAPSRISSITLRSPHRQVYTFDHIQPQWLPATTVIQDGTGLRATPITYSVDEVIVDGIKVVDRREQQFKLATPSAPSIALNLYSVRISGRDALYGFTLGTGAYLQHSDGTVEYQPFDSNDIATFTALPIATYRAGLSGGPGMMRSRIFDLTAGQTVDVSVISYLDIATVLAVGGFLALFAFGSIPNRLRRRLRRGEAQPAGAAPAVRRRPYAVRFGYLSLAGVLACGFVLTHQQAPGIGNARNEASAATVLIPQSSAPVAQNNSANPSSEPAPTDEPADAPNAEASVSPTFYTVWRRNGGTATFGNAQGAASEQVDTSTGQQITVQYFDRARLEYHPKFENTPYQVQLGLLGVEEAKHRGLVTTEPFQPVSASAVLNTPDCEYFAPTGHRVCGRFRDYWHTHGLKLGDANTITDRESLALLGYPISEEFTDPKTGLTIQYFERARLEYHPADAGTPAEVVAGTLNVESP